MALLELEPAYLTPILGARSKHARLDIPLPAEIDQRMVGISLDTLDRNLKNASIAHLSIDGDYSTREGSIVADGYTSYEYKIKTPIDSGVPHGGVWATAHLGLNIPNIARDIVPKQKKAKSTEEAWVESLDQVVNNAVYKLATKELLSRNLTRTDKEILLGSAITALSVMVIGLSRLGLNESYLVAADSAIGFFLANTLGTLFTRVIPLYFTDSDGVRMNIITPELDNALLLLLVKTLFKTFGTIPQNPTDKNGNK